MYALCVHWRSLFSLTPKLKAATTIQYVFIHTRLSSQFLSQSFWIHPCLQVVVLTLGTFWQSRVCMFCTSDSFLSWRHNWSTSPCGHTAETLCVCPHPYTLYTSPLPSRLCSLPLAFLSLNGRFNKTLSATSSKIEQEKDIIIKQIWNLDNISWCSLNSF